MLEIQREEIVSSENNRVGIVTGAGRGIGRAIARKLAREKVKVAVVDIREENLKELCEEIAAEGGQSFPFVGSVAEEMDVARMVEATVERYGQIDILVNNAGISPKKDGSKAYLVEIDLEEWNEVIKVNLTSVFLCCKAVLPRMMERKKGAIVSISSSAALDGGFLAASHYVASKGAISAMTRTLAREGAPYGIRVNAVAPGRIQTPMALLTSQEKNQAAMQRIPMSRFGTTDDVADAVAYLALDESRYITGVTLNVSGGYVLGS
jgi:3-oxoacyl-[acyl-carrier protein] reductase